VLDEKGIINIIKFMGFTLNDLPKNFTDTS